MYTVAILASPMIEVTTHDESAVSDKPAFVEVKVDGHVICRYDAKVVKDQGADMGQYPVVKFVRPSTSSKSPDEVAKGIVDLLKAKTGEDPLRAEDPYLLNHHPFKKGGPYPGPQRTGL